MKKTLIILHDLVATGLALTCAFLVRFEGVQLDERMALLPRILVPFVAFAGFVYWFCSLYRSKWRFASLPDLSNIVRAVTILALALLVLDYILVADNLYGSYFFGRVTIALYWVLQAFFLGGPRLAYRSFRYNRARHTIARENTVPTLLVGRLHEAEIVLRAIESRTMGRILIRGILSTRSTDLGQSLRGVPVLGLVDDLESVVADLTERGTPIRRIVVCPGALNPEAEPERLLARVRRLALPVSRLTSLEGNIGEGSLAPLEIEDLLLRPTVTIDRERLEAFVGGRRILVTGGGGSIGAEICSRLVAMGAADLVVVENSEPALYAVLQALERRAGDTHVHGVLCDVRDRARLDDVFARFRPDAVFHAAALKHVPYLEADWTEGIKTNVFGSVNVAEAAAAAGARITVMVSTDKAIEPVSWLGATKRLAEMVAQAMDADAAAAASPGRARPRLIAVRFGNVLGSNGSVVPKFKAQIAHGGPVTVTHPDMVRYFMTMREAADLVITAGAHAHEMATQDRASREEGGAPSVYVLKMGQPVRIMDLAERMIRLAGLEPGVDVEILVTGARPGERLNEILFARAEPPADIGVDGVMAAHPTFADRTQLGLWLGRLDEAVRSGDRVAASLVVEEAIPEYAGRAKRTVPGASVQGHESRDFAADAPVAGPSRPQVGLAAE